MNTECINIQDYLPHRPPMLMADCIVELDPEKAVTTFEIKPDNIFVKNSKFSEAGLIENLAQTCSSIFGQRFFQDDDSQKSVIGFITHIKKVEILAVPTVGDQIISKARLLTKFGDICHVSCESFLGESLLIRAEISLFIQELNS